eukprot:jgi/Mesen1/7094/ME000369S06418
MITVRSTKTQITKFTKMTLPIHCQRLIRCKVVYADSCGCCHLCLPFFVDGLGCCHVSPSDQEGTMRSSNGATKQDMYMDNQLAIMREVEERKRLMTSVMEEFLQRVKQQKRSQIQAQLAQMGYRQSRTAGGSKASRAEKDALIHELLGSNSQLAGAGTKRHSVSLEIPAWGSTTSAASCSFSPRGRKTKPFHLQQPRAIY